MSEHAKKKYNVIDLFAGAGGLSAGFLQTGRFAVKAAFENNHNAQITYRANHPDTKIYNDVAQALTDEIKSELGNIDVVIGGPPCQGFSNANRQKNHAVSQNNSLVKQYVKAVLHLNPSAFIMENVSMLQSDIHLFYVSENDESDIEKYGIKTSKKQILLLDQDYVFDGVEQIVADTAITHQYHWDAKDYVTLNVIYKNRKNKKKLVNSLNKYKNRLLSLSERLPSKLDRLNPILEADFYTREAIQTCLQEDKEEPDIVNLCNAIEKSIMYQRMLGKAKEINDNKIVVEAYTINNGLIAHVTAMAVIDYIDSILGSDKNGYSIAKGVLAAAEFGAPQKRMRFVVLGIKKDISDNVDLPKGTFTEKSFRSVKDAISDLQMIPARTEMADDDIPINMPEPSESLSELSRLLRNSKVLKNHISTATTPEALERFKAIKQGENFHSLPEELKKSYSDSKRTQNTIYLRLKYDEPSGTVVNVRKSMWIHPVLHRALSIREAARLQTFPDSFVFYGPKDSQYQQIGNAVPPILARALAEHLCMYLDEGVKHG